MDGTPVSGPSFLCQPRRSVQLAQKHRNRPSFSLRSVRPSVPHVGADDSCAGATKTVSPQPSRSDRRTEGRTEGQARRAWRTGSAVGRHDSSESGGDVTRGNTPAVLRATAAAKNGEHSKLLWWRAGGQASRTGLTILRRCSTSTLIAARDPRGGGGGKGRTAPPAIFLENVPERGMRGAKR